jgi:predicted nucleic acid-binding Zn ribbon protein
VFERFQRMSDPRPETCDVCGLGPVETVLYPVPVHYKGSGWAKKERRATATSSTSKSTSDGSSSADPGPKTGGETSDGPSSPPAKAAEAGVAATGD